MKKITFLILLLLVTALFTPLTANAAETCEGVGEVTWLSGVIENGLIVPCQCLDANPADCGINEALQTIVNVSQLILAVTGAAAILVFIYGGMMFIIAAGKQEQIQKGKDALKAAVIGLVIILGAWLLVNFTINAITGGDVGGNANIFGGLDWTQGPQ